VNFGTLTTASETHLNDLQAEMEAGSRRLEHIASEGTKIRDSLWEKQLEQASLMGSLVKQITELRACLKQQRATMRDLRHDIRGLRELATHGTRRP